MILDGNHSVFLHGPYPIFDLTSLYQTESRVIPKLLKKIIKSWKGSNEYPLSELREELDFIIDLLKQEDWGKKKLSRYNILLVGHFSDTENALRNPRKTITGSSIVNPSIISHFVLYPRYLFTKPLNYVNKIEIPDENLVKKKILEELCKKLDDWENYKFIGTGRLCQFFRVTPTPGSPLSIHQFRTQSNTGWQAFGSSYVCLYISYKLGILNDYIC